MGNGFSRRRDAPANSAETVATDQKSAKEPATPQPTEDSGITQTQDVAETENVDVVVGEPATVAACLPSEECVSECKEGEAPAASVPGNAESEPPVKGTPDPVQPEALVSVSESSPPEPEPVAKPVVEPQLAPEPAPEPVPEPEPEVEAVPEPVLDPAPAPADAPEQQADLLTQESLTQESLPSVDLGVPDVTPSPAPVPVPVPVDADEPSDIPAGEQRQDGAEAAEDSTPEPETSERLEKLIKVEAAGCLEKFGSDVDEESVREILQNLELKGNDLVSDLIPCDVTIPDDTPIMDMSVPADLM
ncbi:protein TsetseEP-like [Brachyistius frenatus]|uniref:protein TsetseEP-like n=1 Tax=Brachyistius frenatus TaxID=100188 RepID=UPI0037E8AE72